jgi:hypothetical protein
MPSYPRDGQRWTRSKAETYPMFSDKEDSGFLSHVNGHNVRFAFGEARVDGRINNGLD